MLRMIRRERPYSNNRVGVRIIELKFVMQKVICFLITVGCLVGCTTPGNSGAEKKPQQVLQVRWQRLVDEKGQTCDRCGNPQDGYIFHVGPEGFEYAAHIRVLQGKSKLDA